MDAHPSFAVSFSSKKKSRVKCLSCGYSGDLTDLLLDIRFGVKKHPEYEPRFRLAIAAPMVASEFEDMDLSPDEIPTFEAKTEKIETVFPEKWLSTFQSIKAFPEAMHYCSDRGLELTTLEELDVRFDTTQRRVCFPYRNFKGELMGMQGRAIDKDQPLRYYQYGYYGKRNGHVWMGEDTLSLDEPVVLCEGPFDYAMIWQSYRNVAASFTSGLSRTKVIRIADADTIITFYDYGKGGDSARQSLRKYLKTTVIEDIIPTEQEGDAGAMTNATISLYLQDHVKLPSMVEDMK